MRNSNETTNNDDELSDTITIRSNYCFIPNPLDFEPSTTSSHDLRYEGVSNMSSLFCPNSESGPDFQSINCTPDPDSIKMFVGQIPQTFSECDLLQMFEKFGKVHNLRILRDKQTGLSKGCCFVTFFTRKASVSAQNALHNIKVLPGMHHPIQMKPADSENRNTRKLFVGMLPRKYSEGSVRNLFSPYGTIEECTVLRDLNKQSKGCAFVTYFTRQSAQNAIKSMHHCHIFDGCSSPMVVKFADTQKDKEVRKLQMLQNESTDQQQNSSKLQQVSIDSLYSLLASNSLMQQIQNNGNYNTNPQFPISNHLSYPIAQMSYWNTTSNRSINLPNSLQGYNYLINQIPNQNLTIPISDLIALNNILIQHNGLGFQPLGYQEVHCYPTSFSMDQQAVRYPWDKAVISHKQIEGPDGANLFIYHLPSEFTDQNLAELFNPFGRVISAKVFIDKITKLSKCFGFVSYNNVLSAKMAIQNLNGFHILGKILKVEIKKKKEI